MLATLITKKHLLKKKQLKICFFIFILQGCSTVKKVENVDPYKETNKTVYKVNDQMDSFFFKPVSKGYLYVTNPSVFLGITNFYENLSEVKYTLLNGSNGKFSSAGVSFSRFLINSTLGVLGFFDVAKSVGLNSRKTDTGLVLAENGFSSGPYVVLPFTGGRTARHTLDLYVKVLTNPLNYTPFALLSMWEIVHVRSTFINESELLDKVMVAPYTFTKQAYYGYRKKVVNQEKEKERDQTEIDKLLFDEDF